MIHVEGFGDFGAWRSTCRCENEPTIEFVKIFVWMFALDTSTDVRRELQQVSVSIKDTSKVDRLANSCNAVRRLRLVSLTR